MATDIILRSVKASALTHAEMDQNWESLAQTVDAHTSSATIAVTDQNKILEVSIASGTMTLPTVANAAGTDTDSFRVTIKNIHTSSLTVDGNGAETIEGAASVALLENEAAVFALDSGASEWNIVSFYGPNLPGITATAIELNYNDITTLGTAEASKTMTMDGSKAITGITTLTGTNLNGTTITGTTVNASTTLQVGGVNVTSTAAELNYTDGVTSAIQTQIDGKQPLDADLTAIAALANTNSNFIVGNGSAWVAESGATARTSLGVDAAGVDNSTNVTLAGTPDYITISGQVITRGAVVLTTDVSGALPYANMAFSNNIVAGDIATNAVTTTEIATDTILATNIAASAVGQSEVAASAIGQGELKTTTGVVSSASISMLTQAGGQYGFYSETKQSTTNSGGLIRRFQGAIGYTTYGNYIYVEPAAGETLSAQQRYIQASPPYNLGDGEIGLFIFAVIDNSTGKIESTYIAPEAPWHLNGKTDTKAKYKRNGIPYRMEKGGNAAILRGEINRSDVIKIPSVREQFLALNQTQEELEITQAIKQMDMPVIPHPFIGNDLTGKTVILLDPAHDDTWKLFELHEAGFDIAECLHEGDIKINNRSLKRVTPDGVMCCSHKWKLTA